MRVDRSAGTGERGTFTGVTEMLQNSADGTMLQIANAETTPCLRAIAYVDGPPTRYGAADAVALISMAHELNKLRDLQDAFGIDARFEVDESRGVLIMCLDLDLRGSCFSRISSMLSELKRVADHWSLLHPIRLYRLFGRASRHVDEVAWSTVNPSLWPHEQDKFR